MAVQLFVNGVDLTTKYLLETLQIKNVATQGIVTCSVSIFDQAGTASVSLEHILRVLNNGTEVFEGKIKSRKRRGTPDPGPSPKKTYAVSAQDYTHLLTQDVIDQALVRTGSRTDKTEVEYLISNFGSKGITVGTTVQNTGTITRDIDYTGMNLYEALEEAGKWMGTAFYVDMDLVLHWYVSEANAAPFNLSDAPNGSTTFGYVDLDLQDDSIDLVNAVWVVGNGITGWRTNPTSIGLYGRIETSIRDSNITTQAQLDAAGDGYLLEHAFPLEPISLVTYKDGLRAGMTVQITNALWGLASVTYQIVEVTAKHAGRTNALVYTVKLDSRPVDLATLFGAQARQVVAAGSAADALAGGIAAIEVDLTVAGANLVKNSSFENGSAPDWTVGSVWTFGFAVADALHGGKVARLVAAGVNSGELVTTDYINVVRNDFYWFSFWEFLRSRTAGTYKVVLREYSAGNALLATTLLSQAAVETTWTRKSVRFGPNNQTPGTIVWDASTAKVKIAFFADGTPTGTWDVDGVQFERGKLITAYAPRPQELIDFQITATQIADDAVTTPKLIANAVVAAKIATDAVTADKIAANAVTAAKIGAGAVTVGKLASPPAILLDNGSFEDLGGITVDTDGGDVPGWSIPAGARVSDDVTAHSGSRSLRFASPGSAITAVSSVAPAVAGRKYRCSMWVRGLGSNAGTARTRLNLRFLDGAGNTISNTLVLSATPGTGITWARSEATITAPAGAAYVETQVYADSVTSGDVSFTDDVEVYAADLDIITDYVDITPLGIELRDKWAATFLNAQGFSGPWTRHIHAGGYNTLFGQLSATSDYPFSEVGGADTIAEYEASISPDVPYWVVAGSAGTIRKATDSGAPMGQALEMVATAASQAQVVYQDFPVIGRRAWAIEVMLKSSESVVFGTYNIRYSWRDINHAIIGSSTTIPLSVAGFNMTLGYFEFPLSAGVAPMGAAFLRVELRPTLAAINDWVRFGSVTVRAADVRDREGISRTASGDLALSAGVETQVPFNTSIWNAHVPDAVGQSSGWGSSFVNGYTVARPGLYRVHVTGKFSSGAGTKYIAIRKYQIDNVTFKVIALIGAGTANAVFNGHMDIDIGYQETILIYAFASTAQNLLGGLDYSPILTIQRVAV